MWLPCLGPDGMCVDVFTFAQAHLEVGPWAAIQSLEWKVVLPQPNVDYVVGAVRRWET